MSEIRESKYYYGNISNNVTLNQLIEIIGNGIIKYRKETDDDEPIDNILDSWFNWIENDIYILNLFNGDLVEFTKLIYIYLNEPYIEDDQEYMKDNEPYIKDDQQYMEDNK
jgi:hypothetical protein